MHLNVKRNKTCVIIAFNISKSRSHIKLKKKCVKNEDEWEVKWEPNNNNDSRARASNSGYDIIAPGTSFAASSQLNQNNDCCQLILGILEFLKDNRARRFTLSLSWIDELRRDGEEEAAEHESAWTKWAMWWRRPSQLCRASCRWTPSPVRQNSPPPQNWDTSSEASPTSRPNMWVFQLKTRGPRNRS